MAREYTGKGIGKALVGRLLELAGGEEMEHIYSGIRSMKHDMKNTLSVIMQLATGNEETENAALAGRYS